MMKQMMMAGMVMAALFGMIANAQAADVAAGKAKFTTCIACHGAAGEGGGGGMYPALKGRDSAGIASLLKQYRAGEINSQFSMLMTPQAQALSDEDIANLAAYIATL